MTEMIEMKLKDKSKAEQIKIIEKHLRHYKEYKIGLMTLQKQLDFIMPKITPKYMEGSRGMFNVTSSTEIYAIERLEGKQARMIRADIERYKLIIESIDNAISELDGLEREFVNLRYIERKTMSQVAVMMGYSEKHLFNLRRKIMDKLLISLRGLININV